MAPGPRREARGTGQALACDHRIPTGALTAQRFVERQIPLRECAGAIGAAWANDLPKSHGRFFSRMSFCRSRRVMSSPVA